MELQIEDQKLNLMREKVQRRLSSPTRYSSPDTLRLLIPYVEVQLTCPSLYDIDCNLEILKYFLVFPDQLDARTISRILVLALIHAPFTDFDLCLSLISAIIQQEDPLVVALIRVERLLQLCRFSDFWKTIKSSSQLRGLLDVEDFRKQIRLCMARVISTTYVILPVKDACELLDIEPTEIEDFCNQIELVKMWKFDPQQNSIHILKDESPTSVRFPPNQFSAESCFAPEAVISCLSALNRAR